MNLSLRSIAPCNILVLAIGLSVAAPALARPGPATIGVRGAAEHPRVIRGGRTDIFTYVRNTAAAGSANLNYSLAMQFPYGAAAPVTDTLAADGGAFERRWRSEFDSSLTGYGPQTITMNITDPAATNSPASFAGAVTVLKQAKPFIRFRPGDVPSDLTRAPDAPAQQTGAEGGDTFAAAFPLIFGDPDEPPAKISLDTITYVGDPQLSATLAPFRNLTPIEEDPGAHVAFTIFVDRSVPGTYRGTWYLGFSDEYIDPLHPELGEIPGSAPFGSVAGSFSYTITVVPAPGASAALIAAGALLVGRRARRPAL